MFFYKFLVTHKEYFNSILLIRVEIDWISVSAAAFLFILSTLWLPCALSGVLGFWWPLLTFRFFRRGTTTLLLFRKRCTLFATTLVSPYHIRIADIFFSISESLCKDFRAIQSWWGRFRLGVLLLPLRQHKIILFPLFSIFTFEAVETRLIYILPGFSKPQLSILLLVIRVLFFVFG